MDDGAAPTPARSHTPVMPAECLDALAPAPGETAVDCTTGEGGHASAIAQRLGPEGTIYLVDHDPNSLERARARVGAITGAPRVRVVRGSFAGVGRRLAQDGARADAVLADLGFSSVQMDDPSRGFAFSIDGPLDMRMDPDAPTSAADLVNTLPERELAELIREYGEEPGARRVAEKIARARATQPIRSTAELATIVREAVGFRASRAGGKKPGIDPATRTFQAIRIAVNDEMGALGALLESVDRAARSTHTGPGGEWLAPGARVAIISFHSLEDRAVKHAFAELAERGLAERLTRRPVTPGPEEVARNRRARSAKLRAVRLVPPG